MSFGDRFLVDCTGVRVVVVEVEKDDKHANDDEDGGFDELCECFDLLLELDCVSRQILVVLINTSSSFFPMLEFDLANHFRTFLS